MPQFQSLILLLLLVAMERWLTPATGDPLRIGVPVGSPCPKYVEVKCNQISNKCFGGFSIEVFELILNRIGYKEAYQFIPYNDSYDNLVQQVYSKNFSAAVGDISIVANRTKYVDFSRHYTEMGVRMVVREEPEAGKAWIFVKPFTNSMWAVTGGVFLYNGLIVWLMEEAAGNEELKGSSSFWCQLGSLVWLSFTTLFPIHGEKLRSNLSRATMVVWLFVALVLTQSYTANLTSMLTASRLKPSVIDVDALRGSRAMVGCDSGSFSQRYLENVLRFDKSCIKTYSSGNDYAKDLKSGKIRAAFLELAFIKIFLDENKKGFTVTGPTYELGGYGFAFQKDSPLVGKVSNEILQLRESGEFHKLEEKLLFSSSSKSLTSVTDIQDQDSGRLSLDSFYGLFLVTGGTSTLAFLLFQIGRFHDNWRRKKQQHQDQRVCAKDHVIIVTASSERAIAPLMVKGNAVHDPDLWNNAIQHHKLGRSSTF